MEQPALQRQTGGLRGDAGGVGVRGLELGVGVRRVGGGEVGGIEVGGLELGGSGSGGGVGGWCQLGLGGCSWFEITFKVL